MRPAGLTLDTGTLLALERGNPRLRALLRRAVEHAIAIAVPAGAVAQAWRGRPRQSRLAKLLADPEVDVPPLDELAARAVGLLCGHTVVTSDPRDMHAIDPGLAVINL